METEDIKKLNLWQKISKISGEIGYLQKDDSVGFGNNTYKVISSEKVIGICSEKMTKYGVVVYPVEQEYTRTDEKVLDKNGLEKFNRVSEITVKYEVVNADNPIEKIITVSQGTGVDPQDKGAGKASTYAYKTMLLKLFAISTGNDTDKISSDDYNNKLYNTSAENEVSVGDERKPSEKQIKFLYVLMNQAKTNEKGLFDYYNIKAKKNINMNTMLLSDFNHIVTYLQGVIEKGAK